MASSQQLILLKETAVLKERFLLNAASLEEEIWRVAA